jgi:thymidylate synthase ThyX
MNQIKVKILCDSIIPGFSPRLTTFQLSYPRFIHQELLTHRAFSRNSSSSRAIPTKKLLQQIRNNPAIPMEIGKNCPGMQAKELLTPLQTIQVLDLWKHLAGYCTTIAQDMLDLGTHKQIINRVLEPFMIMHTIVTATDYDNFFSLRCADSADPTMRSLAQQMMKVYTSTKPVELTTYDWHVPYITETEKEMYDDKTCALISAARCARVSYINHDGTNCIVEKDLQLAEKLQIDKHFSPFEHQARAGTWGECNFSKGWTQLRKLIELGEIDVKNTR